MSSSNIGEHDWLGQLLQSFNLLIGKIDQYQQAYPKEFTDQLWQHAMQSGKDYQQAVVGNAGLFYNSMKHLVRQDIPDSYNPSYIGRLQTSFMLLQQYIPLYQNAAHVTAEDKKFCANLLKEIERVSRPFIKKSPPASKPGAAP